MNADTQNLAQPIKSLGEKLAGANPTDKALIADAGRAIEQTLGALPKELASAADILKKTLISLQKLYLEQTPEPVALIQATGRALSAAEAAIATGSPETDLTEAAQTLNNALSPAAQEEKEPAPAEPEKSTEAPSDIPTLDEISAMLMVISSEETEDIQQLADKVALLLAHDKAIPAPARKHISQVQSLLKTILSGIIADGDTLLTEIGRHFSEAQEIVAQAQREQEFGEPETAPEPEPEPETKPEPEPAPEPSPEAAAPEATADAILPDDTDMDLLKEYILECIDHIHAAEAALLDLENDPDATEPINIVFRAFHTIKGTSGFLGLDDIQSLAHHAETLFDRAREGQIRITGGYADISLESCDTLKAMIENLQDKQPGNTLPLPDTYANLVERLKNPEQAGISAEESDTAKAPRVGDLLVATSEVSREQIEEAAQQQGIEPLGKTLVKQDIASGTQVARALRTQKKISGKTSAADSSIRVSTDRLDNLVNMVGELVISQSMIAQDPDIINGKKRRLSANVAHTGKIIRELQDLTMSLRMVPLKPTFQKMARLVRDLGRKAGKNIQFVTEGEDTEIDRSMVEVLNDPLVHMIRNACDHGVETPEERTQAGKDPAGKVTLRAYHSAGSVVIELIDNGKGLDRNKLIKKAVERELIDPNAELTDGEAYMLIFKPGFSTAEKVTDISGRGVGMDVVKRNLDSIRGRVEIASTLGQGSTFTIKVPLTMAITDAMLLKVGDQHYLLPTISIEHSFRPTAGAISTVSGRGELVMLRGNLIPIIRVHHLFNVPHAIADPYDSILIALESEGKRCALMVDELLGQQQVVIKSLGRSLENIPGVAGGAILGDGRVGLILDPTGLLLLAHEDDGIIAHNRESTSPETQDPEANTEPMETLAATK